MALQDLVFLGNASPLNPASALFFSKVLSKFVRLGLVSLL